MRDRIQSGDSDKPYPEPEGLRDMKERYGENPARFLTPELDMSPLPRIRGISDVSLLRAYQAVERRYWERPRVLEAVGDRLEYVENHSMFDDVDSSTAPGSTPTGVPWDRSAVTAAIVAVDAPPPLATETGTGSSAHSDSTTTDTDAPPTSSVAPPDEGDTSPIESADADDSTEEESPADGDPSSLTNWT